ncbi:MAG: hypothetical protein VW397_03200 [Candidatus Margulisiibacteriota bacterium]
MKIYEDTKKDDFKAALKKEVNSSSNIESYLMKIYEDTKKDDLLGQPKKEQEIKKRMDIKFNHFKQIESGGDFNTNLNSWIEENQKERDNYMKEIEEEYGKLAKKQKLIERFEEDYKRELDVKKYFEINDTLEKIEKGEIDRNGGFKYVKSLQSEIQDERLKELLVKRDDLNPIDQRLGEVRDFILEQFKIG